jgi:hypothetical protein
MGYMGEAVGKVGGLDKVIVFLRKVGEALEWVRKTLGKVVVVVALWE